jgi:hypothetical protein
MVAVGLSKGDGARCLMVDKVAILASARCIIQLADEINNEVLRRDIVVEAAAIITLIQLSPDGPPIRFPEKDG